MSGQPTRLLDGGGDKPLRKLLAGAATLPDPPAGARARVWASIARRRRPRRWLLAAAPALALGAILVFGPHLGPAPRRGPEPVATLDLALGRVELASAGGTLASARPGATLASGSRIKVASGGQARVRLVDAAFSIRGEAEVTLRRGAGIAGTELSLGLGTVMVEVDPRRPSDPFLVRAEAVIVRVIGTRFSVAVARDRSTSVRVEKGTVQVETPNERRLVGAGSSWSGSASPTGAATPSLSPGQIAPATTPEPATVPTPRKLAAAASAPRIHHSVRPARSAARVTAPARFPPGSPLAEVAASPRATTDPVPPGSAAGPTDPLGGPAPAADPSRPAIPEPDTDRDEYRRALALGSAGRYREAAAALEREILARGSMAGPALYQLGTWRYLKLGDPRGAIRAFNGYLTGFPDGPLVQEARISLIQAHLEARDFDGAEDAIAVFVSTHPGSERREEVGLLHAHLTRERSGCAEALALYDRLARQAGETPMRVTVDPHADALYFAAACRQELGRAADARQSLERYLSLFPHGRYRAEVERALKRGQP